MSNNDKRGSIKYPDRYKQLIDFSGLQRMRKITPTDIDGFIDYGGNAFVIIEGKHESKDIDYGQRLCMENIVKAFKKAKKIAIAFIFKHSKNSDEIIYASEQRVYEYYATFTSGWENVFEKDYTVLDIINRFENYCKEQNIEL